MNIRYIFILFAVLLSSTAFAQKLKSRGNSFNPDISVNSLFLYQSSDINKEEDGMGIQEIELQFSSNVDSYFAAKALFAIENEDGEYEFAPEEVYIETTSIPHFTIRIGKSKVPFGKHNELHTHTFPFINAPLVHEELLGEEGLNEVGLILSGLIPLPWFSEFSLGHFEGENEDLFNSENSSDKVLFGRVKNLLELSSSTTLELGASAARGKNADGLDTTLYGAHANFKWRPVKGGKYRSFELAGEFLSRDIESKEDDEDNELSGTVAYLKYQLSQRWFAQYRYDHLGLDDSETVGVDQRHTALMAFSPSEFSSLRLQYETISNNNKEEDNEKRISFQFNISMGAHPAHAY